MKTVYVANDGKMFNSVAECSKYEQMMNASYTMFDDNGNVTNNLVDCYYVQLKTEDDAKKFIADNDEKHLLVKGLDAIETGVFEWNDFEETWVWFDEEKQRIRDKVLRALKAQEDRKQ